MRDLGRSLRRSILRDRRARVHSFSLEVEARLAREDVVGAYELLRPWYRDYSGKAPTPSEKTLESTRKTYENLFSKDAIPGGLPFNFDYSGAPVRDDVPDEAEIRRALFRMRSRKALGLTGVTVDYLKEWFLLAFPKEGVPVEGDTVHFLLAS